MQEHPGRKPCCEKDTGLFDCRWWSIFSLMTLLEDFTRYRGQTDGPIGRWERMASILVNWGVGVLSRDTWDLAAFNAF